jgi:hypothetical protein
MFRQAGKVPDKFFPEVRRENQVVITYDYPVELRINATQPLDAGVQSAKITQVFFSQQKMNVRIIGFKLLELIDIRLIGVVIHDKNMEFTTAVREQGFNSTPGKSAVIIISTNVSDFHNF